MKKIMLLSLLVILKLQISKAMPVLNENMANSGTVVIYPDHADANHFYIAPNVVTIARNEIGKPFFMYTDIRKTLFQKGGLLQMTLAAAYTQDAIEEAKSKILQKNSNAFFSGLPFIESSLQLTGELKALIEENQCSHPAGVVGQEQACALVLTPKGRRTFINSIERKTMFTTLQFNYSVQGVIRLADGSLADDKFNYSIAARIDGDQLSNYPELINYKN